MDQLQGIGMALFSLSLLVIFFVVIGIGLYISSKSDKNYTPPPTEPLSPVWETPAEEVTPEFVISAIEYATYRNREGLSTEDRIRSLLWLLNYTKGVSPRAVKRIILGLYSENREIPEDLWKKVRADHKNDPTWTQELIKNLHSDSLVARANYFLGDESP